MEHRHITEGSLVGKLITYDLMRSKPTDKDAGEKSHHREEKLTCNKIKHVKDRHTKHPKSIPGPNDKEQTPPITIQPTVTIRAARLRVVPISS